MMTEMGTDSLSSSSLLSITKPASSYISTSLTEPVKIRLGEQGLAAVEPQNVPEFFHDCCTRYATSPALVYQIETNTKDAKTTTWATVTYKEFEQHVEQAALMLIHAGLQARTSLGILAVNCPEWFYAEFGALRANGVISGIYPSSSPQLVQYILETSQATVCVVDDAAQMAKVREVKDTLPLLQAVIQMHGPYEDFVGTEQGYYRWDELYAVEYSKELHEELERRERDVGANECAMLIFTSGTTGMPKAAMLSHDSLVYNSRAFRKVTIEKCECANSTVTYLPLNHIAAQSLDFFTGLGNGATIYIADREALKGTFINTFVKARPTYIFGVPRVFEKIQERCGQLEANSSALARYTLAWARDVLTEHYLNKKCEASSLKLWLARRITNQIKCAVGLDQCNWLVAGGAPLTDELKKFFLSLDMPIAELYGLTEAGGITSLNLDFSKLRSSGKPLEGIEVKINNPDVDGQGEICVRNRANMMGYLNEPQKTYEVLKEDGWLLSGDMGYLDADGHIVVTGRIKEIVITAGGENIPPVYVENLVKAELPCVSNALLVGDQRKYLTILLTIKTDVDTETGMPLDTLQPDTIAWLSDLDLNYTRLSEMLNIPADISEYDDATVVVQPDSKIVKAIEEALKRANTHALSNAQKVQKFAVLPHDFSIPTGELGPTLKARRQIVLEKYAALIDRIYG